MFLTKLQILGFKSFPQKTELHFDPGMTAIVGPNGCGKTNLLDAIRWVLGEQRTSLLRSSKMEDVIFNGTKDLKPLGMSEVTLIIENNQGILPIDYNQVTVTRRLFRSGESEYLLNKNPCRLKDITELFLDTGVGIHAYSVIQPEMVEAILSDKAEERRFLFEEAAGITKYKLRKREAERKLEHTENDLLRLRDILSEVEKQVNSLRRQKGKAERYKRLTEEIRDLEIGLSRNEFGILKTKEKELEEKLKASADRSQQAATGLDREEAEVENLRLRLLETEKELASIQKTISQLSEGAFQIERDISINRERKSNLEKLIRRNQQESGNLRSRSSSVADEREQKKEQLKLLAEEIDSKTKECEAEEETLLGGDQKLQQLKDELQKLTQEWQEVNDSLNRRGSEKDNVNAQMEELGKQQNAFIEEIQELDREMDTLSQKLDRLISEDRTRRELRESKTEQAQVLTDDVQKNKKDLSGLAAEEARLGSVLEGDKATLHMLQQISEHYEGYGKGEKWVLSAKERFPGIIDTVANLITTRGDYLRAIESALGEAVGFIVCENTESARNIIQRLKEEKAGRATFLPMDRINALDTGSSGADFSVHPGVIGRASDLVQCDQDFTKVADILLGSVILVETLGEALNLSPHIGSGWDLVTLEGEVVKTQAALSGGSAREVSLLGRELEIQKLREKVQQQSQRLQQVMAERGEKLVLEESLQGNLSQVSAEIEQINQQIQQSEIEVKTLEFERGSLNKRKSELQGLVRKMTQSTEELSRKSQEQKRQLRELTERKEKLTLSMDERKRALEKTEAAHTETFKKANQLKIELVSLQGKDEQVKSDVARLSELIQEMEQIQADKTRESEESRSEIEKITRVTAEKEEELKQVFLKIEQDKANLASKTEEQVRWQEDLDLKEKNLKGSRQAKERVQDEMHQLKMQQVELSSQARSIRDRISEEYQVNLDEAAPTEELAAEDTDRYREKLRQTKERLKSVGAVNLLALEEYQSSKQRLDFLQNQVKDLTEAKETLASTIIKINNTARSLFSETFEKTRDNFQKVFEELFDGGETDLRLEESSDPLESPILISARPYGKRLLSISQLSGGEKALTAIALLFAIYLIKPSPFCILDEVDAPLDDANISRFLRLIKHFSSNTQFIVITHNKLTMEAADVLYGVTMEQPGVSKIVSVRFDKHELVTESSSDVN